MARCHNPLNVNNINDSELFIESEETEIGDDVNISDETLIERAVKNNQYVILFISIKYVSIPFFFFRFDVLKEHLRKLQFDADVLGSKLLLACILPVDINIAIFLIEEGAYINYADKNGMTPLHATCKTQKIEITKILLKEEAYINAVDNSCYTPLHYAIENDDLELVDLLLSYNADTSIVECNGWNALMLALHDHESCVEKILPLTSDLNTTASNGWTALMHAVTALDETIVYKLIAYGADVNIHVDGLLPVTLSIERNNTELFNYLWDLTDVEVLKSELELENFIEAMIYDEWYLPNKIKYFFKVLDTPGIELRSCGYLRKIANSMHDIRDEEKFLSIDFYGIAAKLFEKGCTCTDIDMEGFLSLCYRYKLEYKFKILDLLVKHNADINDAYVFQFTVTNDPEFAITLLQFSIYYNPINIFYHILKVKRVDISMLKLIKCLLKLSTPDKKCRMACVDHIKSYESPSTDCYCYALLLGALEYPVKKYIKYDLTKDEKKLYFKLYNEVINLLCMDRIPTLKELARDKVRQCLPTFEKRTNNYLATLPQFLRDILLCKSTVCTLK